MHPILLAPFHFSPPFRFLPVLCIPGARPTKDDSKESDFWKMLHEPEERTPGVEEAQAEVRASFLATSLMRLALGELRSSRDDLPLPRDARIYPEPPP